MSSPTYFTVVADYKSVVVDSITDADADPQLGPVSATVTFTPMLRSGDVIVALDATPRPTGYIAAPIVARIDVDGRLKLRVLPDGVRANYASLSSFPVSGNLTTLYFAIDTQTFYRWNGTSYAVDYPYNPVRLLADTDYLNLPGPLFYRVVFSDVIFNGRPGYIAPLTFQAPDYDAEISLISVTPRPGESGLVGLNAPMLAAVFFDQDGDLVFLNPDQSELDPVEVPDGYLVLIDNGDGTWSAGS